MRSRFVSVVLAASLSLPSFALAKTTAELAAQLSDPKKAQGALDELIAKKQEAVPALIGEALEGKDLEARGWAIAGLAEIGGDDAKKALVKLTDDTKAPMLVRTWAAAARVNMAKSLDEITELSALTGTYPALQRPLTMKVTALASGSNMDADSLLKLSLNHQLAALIAEPILALGVDKLVDVMAKSKDDKVRPQAAAYLGTLAQRQGKAGNELVGDAVAKAYKFDKDAKEVPWAGGPLYVPNIGWDKTFAGKLTRNLVTWHVWADTKGKKDEQKKIHHSLNSVNLAYVVGYTVPGWGVEDADWFTVWGKAVGKKEAKKVLEDVGVDNDAAWKKKLEAL